MTELKRYDFFVDEYSFHETEMCDGEWVKASDLPDYIRAKQIEAFKAGACYVAQVEYPDQITCMAAEQYANNLEKGENNDR